MRTYFVLLFCIFSVVSINLFSQTVAPMWGTESILQKETFIHYIAGTDNEGFYFLRTIGANRIDGEHLWLEYYSNANQNVKTSNELIMPSVDGQPTKYEALYYIDKKLILFTSLISNIKSKRILYVQYLNEDGTLKNKPDEVGDIPADNPEEDGFGFQLSDDKKQIFVYFHSTFKTYSGEYYNFKGYDSELKLTLNKKIAFSALKENKFYISMYKFGKTGNIYMVANIAANNKKKPGAKPKKGEKTEEGDNTDIRKMGAADLERKVLVYNEDLKKISIFDVKLTKFFSGDIVIGLDAKENIDVMGFYIAKAKPDFVGVFYQKFETKTEKLLFGELNKFGITKFTKEELSQFASPRLGQVPEDFYVYKMKDIVYLINGTAVMIAEHYFHYTKTIVDPKTKNEQTVYYYNYNDIFVAGANEEGKVIFIKRIPKLQTSIDDNGYMASYFAVISGSKVKIMFNDNSSNLKNTDPERTKEFKNNPYKNPSGTPMVVTVYQDGSTDKAELFEKPNADAVICPKVMVKNSDNTITTYGQIGKKYKFGNFVFEE